jgi:hypothetical protein
MSEVANWPVLLKSSVDSNHYLPVTGKRRLQVLSLFPSMSTTGIGGQSLYVNITNSNQLNFKGILSSTTGMLSVTTVSNNISLAILPGGIDLDLCDNSTSAFLSSVDLASDTTGTLAVTNGGTGLATIAKGSILYASADDTLSALAPLSNGQLYVGNAVSGVPTAATITAGANVTVTNGNGSITIAANLSTLAATLDCDIYGINLNSAAGTSWISGDGTAEGMTIDASGRIFMGDSTPTLPALVSQLTLGGNATYAIGIGNNNNYGARTIKMIDSTSASAGADLTVEGASGGTGNQNGGNVALKAGPGTGSGTGGTAFVIGGDHSAGTPGGVRIGVLNGGTLIDGIKIDSNGNVSIEEGFLLMGKSSAQVLTGAGAVNVTSQITHIVTTGADALTLADGIEGQTKLIVMRTDGGDGTLTPTNLAGATTITFNDAGDTVSLLFTTGKWYIMSVHGAVVA